MIFFAEKTESQLRILETPYSFHRMDFWTNMMSYLVLEIEIRLVKWWEYRCGNYVMTNDFYYFSPPDSIKYALVNRSHC